MICPCWSFHLHPLAVFCYWTRRTWSPRPCYGLWWAGGGKHGLLRTEFGLGMLFNWSNDGVGLVTGEYCRGPISVWTNFLEKWSFILFRMNSLFSLMLSLMFAWAFIVFLYSLKGLYNKFACFYNIYPLMVYYFAERFQCILGVALKFFFFLISSQWRVVIF